MPVSYKTPDYFRDFRCLGNECPDTCCQHWEIKLDRQHYEMLQEKMAGDPAQHELFNRYIKLNDKSVLGDYDFAHITMRETGYCPMLTDNGLCDIHRRYGIEPLGNTCAFYPRVIGRCQDVIELSGAMSCPEVARLCLSARELPRLVRFSLKDLPRRDYPLARDLPRFAQDAYARYFEMVRSGFIEIASREAQPLMTRLYAMASLAQRLSQFYHRDCEPFPEERLQDELVRSQSDEAWHNWQTYLDQYQHAEPIALVVIQAVLQLKQQQFPAEKTSQLVEQIFKQWSQGQAADTDWIGMYQQAQATLPPVVRSALDAYLTRYLINCLFREWFYTMPDSFTYIQMLLIRLALLRFLITAHPALSGEVARLAQHEIDAAQLQSSFADLAITVTYQFARDIDQNLPFLQVIYNAIGEQQMMNFDYSLPFIKF